jgi:hypothetical protein
MRSKAGTAIIILAVAAVLALGGWYEVSVWRECLTTNSWFYCARVLSH